MMNKRFLHGVYAMATCALMALCLMLSACGMMDYDLPACTRHLKVRFVYDMNMKFADAFPHEVKTLTLYAFDTSGKLVYQHTAQADTIIAKGYMDITDLEPGHYKLMVWAQGEQRYENSYTFGTCEIGSSNRSSLTAKVNRSGKTVDHDITALYYGLLDDADFSDVPTGGERTVTVKLTKDTNLFRVVLQNLSGKPLDTADFNFFITDNNGYLDADNNLLADDTLRYNSWSKYSGQAGIGTDSADVTTGVSAVVAELTTNRLVTGHDMRLHITQKSTGRSIVNIPLIDYCLLVKGQYNQQMSNQEYLDRQDSYDLVFFIDASKNWALSAVIYINSWRVVLQNADIN